MSVLVRSSNESRKPWREIHNIVARWEERLGGTPPVSARLPQIRDAPAVTARLGDAVLARRRPQQSSANGSPNRSRRRGMVARFVLAERPIGVAPGCWR
jgi:hypothetical protein